MVSRDLTQLVTRGRRDSQPRARLHRQDAFGVQRYSAVGCMNEATTTLTRAASLPIPNDLKSFANTFDESLGIFPRTEVATFCVCFCVDSVKPTTSGTIFKYLHSIFDCSSRRVSIS